MALPTAAAESWEVRDANPYAGKLVTSQRMSRAVVEQYRSLAAILYHAQRDKGVRTLMVTSAVPAEGKTLAACNLALTLSLSYPVRVLLIDADFRNPGIHRVFGLANARGLADAIANADVASLAATPLGDGPTVVTAGSPPSDAVRLVSGTEMHEFVATAAEHFDWVVIDTPPAGIFPDAGVLASVVDCAIIVIKAGATPYTMVQRAVEALGRDKVVGTVLNWAEARELVPASYAHVYTAYGASERAPSS